MWLFWGWTIFFIVYCFNRIPDRNFFNWIQSFFRVLSFIAEPQYDVLNIQFYKTHPSNAVTIIVSIDTNFRFQILVWLICFTFARRGFQAAALASCSCSSCYCSNCCSLTTVSWWSRIKIRKMMLLPFRLFFEHKKYYGNRINKWNLNLVIVSIIRILWSLRACQARILNRIPHRDKITIRLTWLQTKPQP